MLSPLAMLLTGYVELFTILRMVIALSDRYTGPAINASYAADPIVGEELDLPNAGGGRYGGSHRS
jgi:hypothetical protein